MQEQLIEQRPSDGWTPQPGKASKRKLKISDVNITSKLDRRKAKPSTFSVFKRHSKGLAIGWRMNESGNGSWTARRMGSDGKYERHVIGHSDEALEANGITVFDYDQAVAAAIAWNKRRAAEDNGVAIVDEAYSVKQAMEDYVTNLERKKRKPNPRTRSVINTHVLPTLGQIPLKKLTRSKLKEWFDSVADAKPRVRTKDKSVAYREIDTTDATVLKQRHSTANRILGVLLAALNYAYENDKVASKAAWERLKKFKDVDRARLRYLELDEIPKFIDGCQYEPFKHLCQADILTGCRYEELAVMLASAFDSKINKVHIPTSKSGKERYIPLNDEGIAFFTRQAEGKKPTDLMFTHSDSRAWEHSQQTYHMNVAIEAAKIEHITFHGLRHTFASHLVMQGVPLLVVATLLGHSDTRMVEKHYGHLRQSYVDDTLRANLPAFGFTARPADPDDPSSSPAPTDSSEEPKLAIVKGRKKAS
jgi:integrase